MINKIRTYLESITISPQSWLVGVLGVVLGRVFLETLSSPSGQGFLSIQFSTILHYFLFYLAFVFVFMFFVRVFVPSFKHLSLQVGVLALGALFIAPILDFIFSKGKGYTMGYLFDTPRELLISFLSFFGPAGSYGITIGIRIEVAIILILVGLFVYFSSFKIWRAISAVLVLYVVIFFFLSFPSILNLLFSDFKEPLAYFNHLLSNSGTILNNLHPSFEYSGVLSAFEIGFNFLIAKIWFIFSVLLAVLYFRSAFKDKFNAIFANSRPERVAHYMFMILVGMVAAYAVLPVWQFNVADYISLLVLALSVYFSWMFAVCINDIVDFDIDQISNTDRPLVGQTLTQGEMKVSAQLFLIASLVGGYLAGFAPFFFVVSFTALYYIYSAPPTRFKLVPFFSSFIIGLCCLSIVLAGFFLTIPIKSGLLLPTNLIVGIVVIFTLWSHIRDMKDIEGDSAAGIKTVPVIFGPKWGPRVVGLFAGSAYILVPVFMSNIKLLPIAIIAGLATYNFVNKKPYKEKPLFLIYDIFIVVSVAFLVLF